MVAICLVDVLTAVIHVVVKSLLEVFGAKEAPKRIPS